MATMMYRPPTIGLPTLPLLLLIIQLFLGSGCGSPNPVTETGDGRLHIAVSILPQEEFVRRIAGELVEVTVLIPPGASPATYEPRPQQIRGLAGCDLYFTVGVPFEDAWLERIQSANPQMRLVDSTAGIQHRVMSAHHHHEGDDHAHTAETEVAEHPDPHVWLAPRLVRVQAENIARALSELSPEQAPQFQVGLNLFLEELDRLDARLHSILDPVPQRKFMVFHPAWGYFADDYGLEMIPVEVGGQEPSGAELATFVDLAREEGLKVILAQPEFSTRAVDTLAKEIDGRVLLASPLGQPWADSLVQLAEALAQSVALGAQKPENAESEGPVDE